MSLSIQQLLGMANLTIAGENKQAPGADTDLYNPDIPDPPAYAANTKKDMYYRSMKLNSTPRNGGGYSLGKNSIYKDPRKEAFSMNNSIDPNRIRRITDPNHSIPDKFSYGSEGARYGLPPSTREERSVGDLTQKAMYNHLSYRDRFSMLKGSEVNPVHVDRAGLGHGTHN